MAARSNEETTRQPHIGQPVAIRLTTNGPIHPGVIKCLVITGDDGEVNEGLISVMVIGSGANNVNEHKQARYHQGAKYVLSWCWPEEVE